MAQQQQLALSAYRGLVGQEVGLSDWVTIDQERIDRFADVTEDWQFIHIDPARARATPFGSTIAHGFLTLSMLSLMSVSALPSIEGTRMGVNYGLNSVRFIAPARSGRRVRGRFILKACAERAPGQWQSTYAVTIEIEDEPKPALVAEWVILTVMA